MMDNLDQQKLIERYLDGNLSPEDEKDFNKALQDPEFKKELLLQARLLDTFEDIQHQELKEHIANQTKKQTSARKLLPQAVKIAAAILLVLVVIYFISPFGKTSYIEQVNNHMIDYPVSIIERGTNDNLLTELPETDQKVLKDALKSYANKDYKQAINAFEQVDIQDEKLLLNKASAHLRLKHTKQAIQILQPLCGSLDEKVAANANWYLALAYLQDHEVQRSIDLLNVISQDANNVWAKEAKSLLTELLHAH